MRNQQKPPPGIVFVPDVKLPDDTVILGIASRLGITPDTYRKWLMAGKGPDIFKLGKRTAARIEVIDAWIAEQERLALQPTPEMRPPEPRLGHTGRARKTPTRQPAAAIH